MTQIETYLYYDAVEYKTEFKYDLEEWLTQQIRGKGRNEIIYDISYEYSENDKFDDWTKRLFKLRNGQNKTTFSNFELREIKYLE